MEIYPAVDLYEGKVVRLARGDFKQETVYSRIPEEMARQWEAGGARWLHVVDLEGAKTGTCANLECLRRIRKTVRLKIQFGGGIRTPEMTHALLSEGMDRVVIGTRSLDEKFLKQALEQWGERIAVGLDVRGGFVQMEGWTRQSFKTLESALEFFKQFPVAVLIYTDIQKDGTLEGPNWAGLHQVLHLTPSRVILSGGIGTLSDIQQAARIKGANFEGAIIGKALYEKKFSLEEALRTAAQAR